MKKTFWFVVLLALCLSAPVDAQVYHSSQAPYGGYGIQATAQPGNAQARHWNNGFVGVNSRHWSPYPMRYGTSSYTGYHGAGPVYVQTYRPHCTHGQYRAYPVHYPAGGYVHGGMYPGGGYVGGGYQGNGWYIQGGVAFR